MEDPEIKEKVDEDTENTLEKPKKPRSQAQIKAFEVARKKRLDNSKIRNEEISKLKKDKDLVNKVKPDPKPEPERSKVEPKPIKEESDDEEEQQIVIVKKKKRKPKIIYLEESDDEETPQPTPPPQPRPAKVQPTYPELKSNTQCFPSGNQMSLRFI
jgi:hypothetical protein